MPFIVTRVHQPGHGQLLEVRHALDPPGVLAGGAERREKQCDQHGNNGDDDQQFYE